MGSTLGNLVTSALPTRHESRALLRLALPIVAVQVGLMLMGVVDTVMVGHLSAQALAAVAIGNLVWFGSVVIGGLSRNTGPNPQGTAQCPRSGC